MAGDLSTGIMAVCGCCNYLHDYPDIDDCGGVDMESDATHDLVFDTGCGFTLVNKLAAHSPAKVICHTQSHKMGKSKIGC